VNGLPPLEPKGPWSSTWLWLAIAAGFLICLWLFVAYT
jgi:hypothetical protein